MSDTLSLLRGALVAQNLDGFLLPVNDEFMGEYVPDCAKRLTWLTGFSGSAGLAVVLKDKAAFFTDGRYTLQSAAEVPAAYEHHNSGDLTPYEWLAEQAPSEAVIGYDPKLHTLQTLRRFEQTAPGFAFKPILPNPIDALWKDRPAAPASKVRIQPAQIAGESSQSKRERVAKLIAAHEAQCAVITAPDSVCWLLNIRGSDVPFTPFVLAYAVLEVDAKMKFYIDASRISAEVLEHLGKGVTVRPPDALVDDLKGYAGRKVMVDSAGSPIWFYQQLGRGKAHSIEASDPCLLPKACKNDKELVGMREAHKRDGLAVTRFLHWVATVDKKNLTEMDVAEKLEAFRKESKLYLEPSFTTIAGSGPDGAIVHYRVTKESNRTLDDNSLLLLDSGGQYQDGTTDITRTVALGTPSAEMKDRFTRVLKGHIALACAVFPEGTGGSQLDALARQYLWQAGLDYDHGTGHGVGSYLSVHEGPQRISKRAGDAPLAPGMVVSNEPGYYKAGEYGIRIESLVAVKEIKKDVGGKRYFGFETLTLAPIDLSLIEHSMLNAEEASWLKEYHKKVYEIHKPNLSPAIAEQLKEALKL